VLYSDLCKETKYPQKVSPHSNVKLFDNVIQKIVQRHLEVKNLLNMSQFEFRTRHSTALYIRWSHPNAVGFKLYSLGDETITPWTLAETANVAYAGRCPNKAFNL